MAKPQVVVGDQKIKIHTFIAICIGLKNLHIILCNIQTFENVFPVVIRVAT